MELDEIVCNSEYIYNNEHDNNIKQCCIIENFEFKAFKGNFNGILLTPICEIYQNKADYLIIAQVIPLKDFYETFLMQNELTNEEILGIKPISNKKFDKTYNNFRNNYLRNRVYRFYFLPENKGIISNSMIDFNLIESLPIKEFKNYKKLCEINNPWKADIIASYAAYSVRIGTNDYSKDFIDEIMSSISDIKKDS